MKKELRAKLDKAIDDYNVASFLLVAVELKSSTLNKVLLELVDNNYYPFVGALGAAGLDFSFQDCKCLFRAIDLGYSDMINVLCSGGFCDPDFDRGKPLRYCAERGYADGVRILYDCGAALMLDRGRAFFEACMRNYLKVVSVMINQNASYARICNSEGSYLALLNQNEAILRLNLSAGAHLGDRHLRLAEKSGNQRLFEIVRDRILDQEKENWKR